MAKIQSFNRLVKENFPNKYHDLVDLLGNSFNPFIEQLLNLLNNNLTIADNLAMQIKDLTVAVDSSGNPLQRTTYNSTLKTKTTGICVIKAQNQTNSALYPTSCPFVSFTDNSGTVTINNITGLQPNNTYVLTIQAIT